jgi:FtsZ-binding cell division protein ZapB
MSTVTISATFNKQTKDSKKELVQFHVKGQDEHKPELNLMCREAVELRLEGIDQVLTAKFEKKSQDSSKTVLDFILMGNPSTSNSFEFYRKSGQDVILTITESQMSIDELKEAHEGIKYTQNSDGTVDVDQNQLSMDDEITADELLDG